MRSCTCNCFPADIRTRTYTVSAAIQALSMASVDLDLTYISVQVVEKNMYISALFHSNFIHAYCYSSTIFVPENHKISRAFLEMQIASHSSGFCHSGKTTNKHSLSSFSREWLKLLYWNLLKPLLDALHMHKRQICRFIPEIALQMHERHKARRSFSEVSWREHRICEAASQLDLWNCGAICKNVSCARESMARSTDRAPAKLSPVKRRRFQMF